MFRLFISHLSSEKIFAAELQEALLNADSPTNLSWLINNHEATGNLPTEAKPHDVVFDPDHAARLAFAPEDSRSPVFVFINLDGEIIYQGEWPGDDAAQELARTAAGE